MTTNNRLGQFIQLKKMSYSGFEKAAGLTNATIGKIVDKGMGFGNVTAEKIFSAFPELNPSWLFTGIGEMIKTNKPETKIAQVNAQGSVQPMVITVDELGSENIVLVDTKAAAGYPTRYIEPEFYGELPAFKMPGGEYRHGTFRAFEVSGDSMHDTLVHGDVVIAQYVDSFQHMKEGYIHVIVTTDQVLVKRPLNRIQKSGRVILQSDNNAYPPYPILAEDIRELWVVKANVTRFMPNRNRDVQKVLNDIMGRLSDVEEQIQAVSGKPVVKKK